MVVERRAAGKRRGSRAFRHTGGLTSLPASSTFYIAVHPPIPIWLPPATLPGHTLLQHLSSIQYAPAAPTFAFFCRNRSTIPPASSPGEAFAIPGKAWRDTVGREQTWRHPERCRMRVLYMRGHENCGRRTVTASLELSRIQAQELKPAHSPAVLTRRPQDAACYRPLFAAAPACRPNAVRRCLPYGRPASLAHGEGWRGQAAGRLPAHCCRRTRLQHVTTAGAGTCLRCLNSGPGAGQDGDTLLLLPCARHPFTRGLLFGRSPRSDAHLLP